MLVNAGLTSVGNVAPLCAALYNLCATWRSSAFAVTHGAVLVLSNAWASATLAHRRVKKLRPAVGAGRSSTKLHPPWIAVPPVLFQLRSLYVTHVLFMSSRAPCALMKTNAGGTPLILVLTQACMTCAGHQVPRQAKPFGYGSPGLVSSSCSKRRLYVLTSPCHAPAGPHIFATSRYSSCCCLTLSRPRPYSGS